MAKLVGFKRFKSKKGDEYVVANVISNYSENDKNRGCIGQKIEEIFLPQELVDYLQPNFIGKDVQINYEVSGGRAYLSDFNVL